MIQDADMLAGVKAAVFDAYGTLFGAMPRPPAARRPDHPDAA